MVQYRFRCPCCSHTCTIRFSQLGQVWHCPYSGQAMQLPPRLSPPAPRAADWAAAEPDLLLDTLSALGGLRERRLALVAVGRTMLADDDEYGHRVADIAESLADGQAPPAEVGWAR